MVRSSLLTNAHLNGLLHYMLWDVPVGYLTGSELSEEYRPGSEPVFKDVDFGWIPVPDYAGDVGDSQFLRYTLAPHYRFIIEPHEGEISVTCVTKDREPGNPISATNAVEITAQRATAVAIFTMLQVRPL